LAAGTPIRNVIAAVLGHVPESYDFTIFTPSFGFFPANDPLTGLLLVVSTVGVCSAPIATATAANRR
jgi:hypothetical protein